jgi:hypothetical protein
MAALTSLGLGAPDPEDVEHAARVQLGDDDLEFAIAYCLAQAYDERSDVERSTRWATAARVAAREVEDADSAGGRLAAKYGLEIAPPVAPLAEAAEGAGTDQAAIGGES